MGLFNNDKKGFFDNIFDFNGDGKTSLGEKYIAYKIFEECNKDEDDSYDDFDLDLLDNTDDSEKYAWRDSCEYDYKVGVNPYDYETEEEYDKAVYEAKYGWRDYCESYYDTGVDPDDYETEEEYEEALNEEKYGWRDICENGLEYGIHPENYESKEEYEDALNEAKYGWRDTCDDGLEYGIYPEDYETEEEYTEALNEEKYGWRDTCDDGLEYGIFPEDYETEEEYTEALNEEKYGWRDTCDDGLKYGVDPDDYKTEEEYEDVLSEANESVRNEKTKPKVTVEWSALDKLDEIKEENYPNKRRYNAAYILANKFICYSSQEFKQKEKACCKFILDNADKIIAANYLSNNHGFIYAQAIKDNFTLPCSLPDEDETKEMDFSDILLKLAKRDVSLSFDIWNWCLKQFLPYAQYDEFAEFDLTSNAIDSFCDLSEEYKTKFIHYLDDNPDFCKMVIIESKKTAYCTPELIAGAIKYSLHTLADNIFKVELEKNYDDWKQINWLTKNVIFQCENYEELESMEYFRDNLLPLVKAIQNGMVQDEIPEWEKSISDYIDRVEDDCEQYAYTRKNAWRKTVPNGKDYGLDPIDYDSEQEYLEALNEEKYGWRKWYISSENYGLNVENFESEQEYEEALNTKAEEERQKEHEKRQQERIAEQALDQSYAEDKTVYIYCGVLLPFSSRPYSFRTEDDTMQLGDTVIVPVGKDEKEMKGTVVSIGKYLRLGVPFPVERTKFILRKVDEEE
jgi:hypothetical protein